MEKQKKIAIVRTDKIGDVVLTLPLVKEIISHYPNSIVDFIVQEYTLPIVKFNQHIHKVYSIPNKLIDITKLTQFGWQHQTSLEEGIKETVEYFKTSVLHD